MTVIREHNYAQELDPDQPLNKPFGGRLLSLEEGANLTRGLGDPIERVRVNLEHLRSDVVDFKRRSL
jgi:hypothetical protein